MLEYKILNFSEKIVQKPIKSFQTGLISRDKNKGISFADKNSSIAWKLLNIKNNNFIVSQ